MKRYTITTRQDATTIRATCPQNAAGKFATSRLGRDKIARRTSGEAGGPGWFQAYDPQGREFAEPFQVKEAQS